MIALPLFPRLRLGYFCIAVALLFVVACTDRGQNPPSVRDGVSTGAPDTEAPAPPPDRGQPPAGGDLEPPPSPLGEYAYSVLVDAFAQRLDADHLAYQLRMKRINNFVYLYEGEWRVCVGTYATKARARRTLRQVHEKGFTSARVIGPGDDGIAPPRRE